MQTVLRPHYMLNVRKVGSSLGVTIPADLARRYGIENGTELVLVEGNDGELILSVSEEDFDRRMQQLTEIAEPYREALDRLPDK
ncbi:MAG: AbrB/MazE/SpoVT family DNA-binding domain-containing protein [Candidatus Poribacteria bacterium]|nr:AbrB/MazE/SpoVT family DNA-binding domain-containing protein [Candidatus Poribacteria bacterium]